MSEQGEILDTGHGRRHVRVRGHADWKPRPWTVALLEQVQAVLREYAAYLPLTLRQVFYRLVGAHGYDKTEQAYDRLGEALNRARRAGMIPWEALRDDGFAPVHPYIRGRRRRARTG